MTAHQEPALELVSMGMAVVEVAAAREDGTCSCRLGADCHVPGKHPVGKGWMRSALARSARAKRPSLPAVARLAPVTSYGLVPTPGSGLIVIDRDDPDVGLPMPETFEVHRESAHPRKGHYYFRLADDVDESEVPRAFSGGEIRVAASGFVVGPGCRHSSGDLYAANGADVGIADRELIDALSGLRPVRRTESGQVEAVLGSRRAWLTSQARKYRGWGFDADDIVDELRKLNEEVCEPSLTEAEFADVIRAVEWAVREVEPDRNPVFRRGSWRSGPRRGTARGVGR